GKPDGVVRLSGTRTGSAALSELRRFEGIVGPPARRSGPAPGTPLTGHIPWGAGRIACAGLFRATDEAAARPGDGADRGHRLVEVSGCRGLRVPRRRGRLLLVRG